LTIEQWEDTLRVAGSLSTGTVRASELMRVHRAAGAPPVSDERSRSSAASRRPSTSSAGSTARNTAANAQYLDDAIAYLRATGHKITDEDLQRLSPLEYEHITMLGNFPFKLPGDLAAGQRRQLRGLPIRLAYVPVPFPPED
jgi:hypothetical protein